MAKAGRKPAPPFDAKTAARIRRRYDRGTSIAKLAAAMHTSTYRIRAAILADGGSLKATDDWPSKRRKINPDQSKQIASEYLRGRSKRELSEWFGVSIATISHHLRKHGIGAPAPERNTTA